MASKGSIFINYRRTDTLDFARILKKDLAESFGSDATFLDESSIKLTSDWQEGIKTHLRTAQVMISLIGPAWKDAFKPNQDDETDWVLFELTTAMCEGVTVLPVFIDGANNKNLPDTFPTALQPLLKQQGIMFEKGKHQEATQSLIGLLKNIQNGIPDPRLDILAALPYDRNLLKNARKRDCPYIGLRHFEEAEAALYFGRDYDIRRLYFTIRRSPLTLFSGYSGAGKSSLLNAGLLPRLKQKNDLWHLQGGVHRRDKARGLHQQLTEIVATLPNQSDKLLLIILDQVEEMYTDPTPFYDAEAKRLYEHELLAHALDHLLDSRSDVRVVLSFRAEYDQRIKEDLKGANIIDCPLPPLKEAALMQAIRSTCGNEELNNTFKLEFDNGLPEKIAADIKEVNNDKGFVHTPLLQAQMEKLWNNAKMKQAHGDDVRITLADHEEYFSLNTRNFLNEQIQHLLDEHPGLYQHEQDGLVLDILYAHTTPKGTATSVADEAFAEVYKHVADQAAQIRQYFSAKYLLIPQYEKTKKTVSGTRLAHDTLAPEIRDLYEQSDKPGQRAWRLIEARMPDHNANKTVEFSEIDIDIIEAGKQGMRFVAHDLWQKIRQNKATYIEARQRDFELAIAIAQKANQNFEFEEALKWLNFAEGRQPQQVQVQQLGRDTLWGFVINSNQAAAAETLKLLHDAPPSIDNALGINRLRAFLIKQQHEWATHFEAQYLPTMLPIEGGHEFTMGDDKTHPDSFPQEVPEHRVVVSSFHMADTPVTCWQFGLYCVATGRKLPNEAGFGRGQKPIVNVSWGEATAYCNWLSELEGLEKCYPDDQDDRRSQCNFGANGYRLPTEAEWEYAARGGRLGIDKEGKSPMFGNGKDQCLPDEINFDCSEQYVNKVSYAQTGKYLGQTTDVRSYDPNALGLYDMAGNVFEWCFDWYIVGEFYSACKDDGICTDPYNDQKPADGYKAIRGGSWYSAPYLCRVSYRYRLSPLELYVDYGFRVVRR